MKTPVSTSAEQQASAMRVVSRVAVGINGFSEGLDAAALGAAISRATDASMMLVAVHLNPMIVVPQGLDWRSLHKQARDSLAEARDAFAADARLVVSTDNSVPRALHRVVGDEHRDLLVVGSSRHAPAGHVRIGKRTRQLLCHFECALAIAPRGLHEHSDFSVKRIGVGYDGGPESRAALAWAASVAVGAGAEVCVRAVVDDRMPTVGWGDVWIEDVARDWVAVVNEEKDSLRREAQATAEQAGLRVDAEGVTGRPADALLELSAEVDLLVIGSRRWGPVKRVLLGSTGEALMHDASCAVVAVPRPTGN
jgi:nucleotide-binding universal stress UspA family protein